MSTKEKILEALGDLEISDISETRLIDLLLDAYQEKVRQVTALESENVSERQSLQDEYKRLEEEHRRIRQDPLYCMHGDYYFINKELKIQVSVQGFTIEAFLCKDGIGYALERVSPDIWVASK